MAKPIKIAVAVAIGIGVIGIAVSGNLKPSEKVSSAAEAETGLRLERCVYENAQDGCKQTKSPVQKATQASGHKGTDIKQAALKPKASMDYKAEAKRMRRERAEQVSPAARLLKQGTGPTTADTPRPKPQVDRRNDPPPEDTIDRPSLDD